MSFEYRITGALKEIMLSILKNLIIKLWPLPPVEKRRNGIIPVKWFHYALRLDRTADYICYQLTNLLILVGFLLIGAILLDAQLATGVLIDAEKFEHNNLLLPVTFVHVIALPALVLTFLFYLRIRLQIVICHDDIPVLAHKALLLTTGRRRWIGRSLFGIAISVLCFFAAHIVVIKLTLHFDMQNSLVFILIPQVFFGVGGPAIGALGLIAYSLVLEKAIRCYPALQENLKRNHEYALQKHNNP